MSALSTRVVLVVFSLLVPSLASVSRGEEGQRWEPVAGTNDFQDSDSGIRVTPPAGWQASFVGDPWNLLFTSPDGAVAIFAEVDEFESYENYKENQEQQTSWMLDMLEDTERFDKMHGNNPFSSAHLSFPGESTRWHNPGLGYQGTGLATSDPAQAATEFEFYVVGPDKGGSGYWVTFLVFPSKVEQHRQAIDGLLTSTKVQ